MAAILPGATIGFLGGGQLGRMAAMAARSLEFGVRTMDPSAGCAAGAVSDVVIPGRFDDAVAAAELARGCSVITCEIEQIGAAALAAAQAIAPVRPGPHVLEIVRDRSRQKGWLKSQGFPIGTYREVASLDELLAVAAELGVARGTPLFIKANHGGYDGRGQVRLDDATQLEEAWVALAGRPSVAERGLALEVELSVMVARNPSGAVAVYPPALNHHEDQVLAWSVLPGPLPPDVAHQATTLAAEIAEAIHLEGLLCVEMFLTRDGTLLVNELAPRPHNSYHTTEVACLTSQFEQLVRAVCDLPLGDPRVLRPGAIVNLFGDLWHDGTPRWDQALEVPGTRLHLYGKGTPRPGRKMGHLAAIGDTPEDALERARTAFTRLHAAGALAR